MSTLWSTGCRALIPTLGYKQSGIGRDKSLHAMDKYCQVKNTFIQL